MCSLDYENFKFLKNIKIVNIYPKQIKIVNLKNDKNLCTVGPSTINSLALKKLEKEKVSLLRINLSHTNLDDLKLILKQYK